MPKGSKEARNSFDFYTYGRLINPPAMYNSIRISWTIRCRYLPQYDPVIKLYMTMSGEC